MSMSKSLLQQPFQRLDPLVEQSAWLHNRRHFLQGSGISIATAALSTLLSQESTAAKRGAAADQRIGGLPDVPHFPPTAKRVIYLCQSGAPSQIDLFDYKPKHFFFFSLFYKIELLTTNSKLNCLVSFFIPFIINKN